MLLSAVDHMPAILGPTDPINTTGAKGGDVLYLCTIAEFEQELIRERILARL